MSTSTSIKVLLSGLYLCDNLIKRVRVIHDSVSNTDSLNLNQIFFYTQHLKFVALCKLVYLFRNFKLNFYLEKRFIPLEKSVIVIKCRRVMWEGILYKLNQQIKIMLFRCNCNEWLSLQSALRTTLTLQTLKKSFHL